jgi:hypothetical protein
MTHLAIDQADGLRRMLAAHAGHTLLLIGPACDAQLNVNLAAALGAFGRTVSVVDGNVLRRLAGAGTSMLQAMQADADTVLLDCSGPWAESAELASVLVHHAHHVLVAFADAPDGIKQSYLLLKALGTSNVRPMRVLVTEARSAQSALHMYSNLAATVRQYLGVDVALAGYIPHDTHLDMAHTLGKSVIATFPASAAARACRQVAREIASWRANICVPLDERQGTSASGDEEGISISETYPVSPLSWATSTARFTERVD